MIVIVIVSVTAILRVKVINSKTSNSSIVHGNNGSLKSVALGCEDSHDVDSGTLDPQLLSKV